jgi:putative restriction endonuclease
MAGIGYQPGGVAESVVVSGGYKDDIDYGARIIYTGQGGQLVAGSGRQQVDQSLERGNRALVNSQMEGNPVRVIRGWKGDKDFSPNTGYRYDGLYEVRQHWWERSKDGPLIIRFELLELEGLHFKGESQKVDLGDFFATAPSGNASPERKLFPSGSKIARDPNVTKWVKDLYKNKCQICGIILRTPTESYSEGAHIRGLGSPHLGSDVIPNMLCLCPNCHKLLDFGSIYIESDLVTVVNIVTNESSRLTLKTGHEIDGESVAYHRIHIAGVTKA